VRQELINQVTQQYQKACKTPSPKDRLEEFKKVIILYPDSFSEIYKNTVLHLEEAKAASEDHRSSY
jgi:hypothetical protein